MISEKRVCAGLAAGAFLALAAASVSAQGWIDYVDKVDRFGVSLPGQPAIQEITYTSWRLHTLPARVYTVEDGPRRYSVTVVN